MEAISIKQITKSLGKREILRDVSFTVQRGDVFGFLGPNGAGKTTTIRIILGLLQADHGDVHILGQSVERNESRRNTGFVLEADGLYENLNAYDNLDFYCQLYRVPQSERPGKTKKILHLVGLQDRIKDKVSTYSKGMRQKLVLARALVHDPELIILDEPTAGLDPSVQMEVRDTILNLAHKEGKTVFLSSHNLDEVQRICNRIALIDKGQIRIYGELDKLRGDSRQQEVVIGIITENEEKAGLVNGVLEEIQSLTYVENCRWEEDRIYLTSNGRPDVSEIVGILSRHGIGVGEIKKSGASLEEIYARAVGRRENE